MLVVERSSMGPEILLRMVPAEKECLAVRLRVGTGAVFWDLDPFRVVNARERAIAEVHGAIWRKKSRCVVWYGSRSFSSRALEMVERLWRIRRIVVAKLCCMETGSFQLVLICSYCCLMRRHSPARDESDQMCCIVLCTRSELVFGGTVLSVTVRSEQM